MTQEEKARAYDEALEDMRAIYPNLNGDAKLAVEHAFPELAESEDERIRKGLIEMVSDMAGGWPFENHRITKKEALAYLEKQREPHYTKRNALFDKCVENCDPEVMKSVSDEVDEMLKKEQKPDWKPSKKQMKALEDAFRKDGSDEYRKTINSLYQDLKKL